MPRTEDAADAGKIFFESTAAGGIVRPLVEVVLVRLRALLELYRETAAKSPKCSWLLLRRKLQLLERLCDH